MYISYCSQVCKHLFSPYDPINRTANTLSNYDVGIQNKYFRRSLNILHGRRQVVFSVLFFRAREKKTREGWRGDGLHAFSPVVRAHATFVLKKWRLLYSFKIF